MSSDPESAKNVDHSEAGAPAYSATTIAEYADLIAGVELQQLWLAEATVRNFVGPNTPRGARLRVDDHPEWCEIEGGFRAQLHYKVSITVKDEPQAEIDVTFAVDFSSSLPMTDELFDIFGVANLPLNTWPFLREFVHTTFGRMNWLPFALPSVKRGPSRTAVQEKVSKKQEGSPTQRSTIAGSEVERAEDEQPRLPLNRKGRQSPGKEHVRKSKSLSIESSSDE